MPAPTTPILDNFNRANGPLGAAWTAVAGTAAIVSNQAKATAASTFSYWNAGTYHANQESYLDLVTKGTAASNGPGLLLRYDSGAVNGYNPFFDTNLNVVAFFKVTGGVFAQIGSNTAVTLTAGDSVMARMIGSTLSAYYKTGGVWAFIASVTDTTYTAAGYVGLQVNDTTTVVDNFGGGAHVPLRPRARRVAARPAPPSLARFP